MHFCRICRTENNLKYTSKQLRRICKSQQKNIQFSNATTVLMPTPPTLGNICNDCEERLHNFHVYDAVEEENSDVDVECSDGKSLDLFLKKFQQQEVKERSCYGESNNDQLLQLGSDGDTEIIEVLTSRENTPVPDTVTSLTVTTPQKSFNVDKKIVPQTTPQRIVAIIDLDDEPEYTASSSQECQAVEHIVDKPQQKISPVITAQKRKPCRKIYNDKPLVLVASLSLVSSDSEEEDEQNVSPSKEIALLNTKTCAAKPNNAKLIHKISTHSKKHSRDANADAVSINICVKCPVCELQFLNNQRLVHHMRCKHRSYQGDALNERSRCAQDSAMTIRLRYMQRYTYYECQLCGRIDVAFKEHKEHIMQQHADESKSLKDPMMKQLKCPVCKEKCGTQYLHLCRHLLCTHKYVEYKTHLREVKRVSKNSGCNRKERNARIFQFTKRKNFFFECKLCQKVVDGVMKHVQHLNAHHAKPTRTNEKPLEKKIPKDKGVKVNKKQEYRSVRKSVSNSEPEEQLKEKKASSVHKKFNKTVKKVKQSKLETATAGKEQNGKEIIKRHKRKLNKKTLQAALIKVKVKAPLRHFRTQKYKCRHCANVFKGFYSLNLHLLSAHSDIEYQSCQLCACAFTSSNKLRQHESMHRLATITSKRKRKQLQAPQNQNNSCVFHVVDENDNTDYCNKRLKRNYTESKCVNNVEKTPVEPAYMFNENLSTWLQDLIAMNRQTTSNQISTATKRTDTAALHNTAVTKLSTTYQCVYCTNLFVSMQEWQAHENVHIQQQEIPLIRRQQTLQLKEILNISELAKPQCVLIK